MRALDSTVTLNNHCEYSLAVALSGADLATLLSWSPISPHSVNRVLVSLSAINVLIPPHDRSADLFCLDLQYETRHFSLRRRVEVL